MLLREKYTTALIQLGFKKIASRSTKYDVYFGTTKMLYNSDVQEDRYVFVSTRGSSLRIGKSPNVTSLNIPVGDKTKSRLISLGVQ